MDQRSVKRKAFLFLVLLAALMLLTLLVYPFLAGSQPKPPSSPNYTISVVTRPGVAWEVRAPPVLYPNGSIATFVLLSVAGNGVLELSTVPAGPAFLLRGNGAVSVEIGYDFPPPRFVVFSRFPEGLPDFGLWTGPDLDPADRNLGAVNVSVTSLSMGEVLDVAFRLEYAGGIFWHEGRGFVAQGDNEVLVTVGVRQG